jgi:putative endonuclease
MAEILSITKQNIRPPTLAASETGRAGERLAASFLESNGYRLVVSNFKVPIGRNRRGAAVTGEIDIVALDGDLLCFVEVKARTSEKFATPEVAVNRRKQRQITRTARVYRRVFGLQEMQYRYDVVSVVLLDNAPPSIELLKDFWAESKFRKKVWTGDIY